MDDFTIVVAAGTVFLILAVLLAFMWRQDPAAKWLGWYSAAYFIAVAAGFLIAPRGQIANILSMGFGTALILISLGCFWVGARVFQGLRPILWPLPAAAAAWLALFLIPGFDADSNQWLRVLISSLPSAAFPLLAAWELWRGRSEPLPSRMPAIVVCLASAFFYLLRGVAANWLAFPLGGNTMHPMAVALFNLVMGVTAVFISVLMVSMTKERRETVQRQLAETDALTGLPNRRAFATEADTLLRRQKQAHSAVALLILDLDHFKSINDRYGHEAGDKVLIEFAGVLNTSLRRDDLRFRIGGEEFCCMLPGASMREAQLVAERICQTFQATTTDVLGGSVRATVSIGVSSTDICGYILEDLVNEADAATYEAKATGRNRAVLAIALPKAPALTLVGNASGLRSVR